MRSRIHLGQIVAPTVEKDEAVLRKIGQVDRNSTKMSTATVRTRGPGALADGHRRQSPRRTGSGSGRYLLAGSALSRTTPSDWACVGGSITLTTGMTVSPDKRTVSGARRR